MTPSSSGLLLASGNDTTPPGVPADRTGPGPIATLFRNYKGRILITYALFNLENGVRLVQPIALGWAISCLTEGSCRGLAGLLAQHAIYLVLGAARRMYDTRTFTGIYSDLASGLVLEQRRAGVAVSRVAARSALSRQLVDFFERDVPFILHAFYSLCGALLLLALYDGCLALLCLLLLPPTYVLGRCRGWQALALNRRLHDQAEREVEVIHRAEAAEVRGHFALLARWRVQVSDGEAIHCSLLEVLVLGLMTAALVRSCQSGAADAGHVSAVLGYVLMFGSSLINVPVLVDQFGRLSDITRRLDLAAPLNSR